MQQHTGGGLMDIERGVCTGGSIGDAIGELRCDSANWRLSGRTLRLAIWLATHQARINAAAGECGQLWLTWKGERGAVERTISGDLRTRL